MVKEARNVGLVGGVVKEDGKGGYKCGSGRGE